MKRFIQLLFLVALSMYNAIQTVTGGATLKKLAPSGVINQGILGGFSGKVGPVVGGKWKDIDYMRSYVIPANPNTTAQQAVRARFAACVAYARTLLATILQPFWDPFYSDQSGFNAWISQNYSLLDGSDVIDQTAIISKGTLEGDAITQAEYDTATGAFDSEWAANIFGNGETDDNVGFVIIDKSTGKAFYNVGVNTRNDGGADFSIDTGLTATNLMCFLFFYRGTGSELIVSDSDGVVATAA